MPTRLESEINRALEKSSRREAQGRLEAARDAVAQGRFDEAASVLLELGNDFHYAGLPHLVLATIEELRELIPPDDLFVEWDAWAANFEALGLSALGQEEAAGALLERMLDQGRALDDKEIISTALQNLGVQALIRGDDAEAIALAHEASRMKLELGNHFAAAQILLNVSTALQSKGDYDEAESALREIEDLITDVGEPGLIASLNGNLGQLQARRGDFDHAEGSFRTALRFARKAGDLRKEVMTLQNLGALEVEKGRPGRALRWYRRGIHLAERADAPPDLELLYRSMAAALHRSHRDDEAAEWLQAAQRAAERFGDRRLYAGALADLGALRVSLGDAETGRPLLEEAGEIFVGLGEADSARDALRNLAVTHMILSQPRDAVAVIERALELVDPNDPLTRADLMRLAAEALIGFDPDESAAFVARELNEAQDLGLREAAWRSATGASLLREGDPSLALPLYERAIQAAVQLEDDQLLFDARNDRGTALIDLEQYEGARDEFQALIVFARERANRAMEHQAVYNLGETERRRGETKAAISQAKRAVGLARELRDRSSEAESLANLGAAFADADDPAGARAALEEAQAVAESEGLPNIYARAASTLGLMAFREENYAQAATHYRVAARAARDSAQEKARALAGILESVSAAGRASSLERTAQRLVDVAQDAHLEEDASAAFARSAWSWLSRNRQEEASSLYAIAILLTATGADFNLDAEGEEVISPSNAASLLMPFAMLAYHAYHELGEDRKQFYKSVLTTLNEDYEGIGEQLAFILEIAESARASTSAADD